MQRPETKLHGCHNRPAPSKLIIVQDGWNEWFNDDCYTPGRTAKYKYIPDPMTKECQYTRSAKTNNDPQCAGCRWRAETPDLP